MNFWEKRREELGLSQRKMAARLGMSNQAVAAWEQTLTVPQISIAKLAECYEVSEERIERELIVQRRAIEAAREKVAAKSA